jgi:ribosome modulation factor
MTKDNQRAYEFGEQAAMRGLSRDDCPYRNADPKAYWLRGWHAWHNAQQPDPIAATPAARANLARLKAMLSA